MKLSYNAGIPVVNKYEAQAKAAREANRRRKMCEAKAVFESEEEAYQKNQTAYCCRYCGKWHRSGAFTKLIRSVQKRTK